MQSFPRFCGFIFEAEESMPRGLKPSAFPLALITGDKSPAYQP
jgi:hypothetical protein